MIRKFMINIWSVINVNHLWTLQLQLMETEMKKLQAATRDATKKFDETLMKLFEKKIKCEMAICQVSQHTHTHTHAVNVCDTWIHNTDTWSQSASHNFLLFPSSHFSHTGWRALCSHCGYPPWDNYEIWYLEHAIPFKKKKKNLFNVVLMYFTGRAQDYLSQLFSPRRRRDAKSRAGAQAQTWKNADIQGQKTYSTVTLKEFMTSSFSFCYLWATWVNDRDVFPNSSLLFSHHSGVFCKS